MQITVQVVWQISKLTSERVKYIEAYQKPKGLPLNRLTVVLEPARNTCEFSLFFHWTIMTTAKQKSSFGKSRQIVKVRENSSDNESVNSFSFQVIIMTYIFSAECTIAEYLATRALHKSTAPVLLRLTLARLCSAVPHSQSQIIFTVWQIKLFLPQSRTPEVK